MKRLERRPFGTSRQAFHSARGGGGAVVFDVDGDVRIGGLHRGDVCFVSANDGSRVWSLSGAGGTDRDVCALWASEKSIVVATVSLLLRQWTVKSWDPLAVELASTTRTSNSAPARHVDLDRTETLVATGSADRTARIFDTRRNLVCTHNFKHDGVVTRVALGSSSPRMSLATACETFAVTMWDLHSKSKVAEISEHLARVSDLLWVDDMLITASHDETLGFWNREGQRARAQLAVGEQVEAIALLKGKKQFCRFATAGSKGLVKTWTMVDEEQLQSDCVENDDSGTKHLSPYSSLGSTRSGGLVALNAEVAKSFNISSLDVIDELLCSDDPVVACEFHGNTLAVASAGSETVRFLDDDRWRCARRLEGHTDVVLSLAVEYGLAVTGSKDRTCRVWNLDDDNESPSCTVCVGHVDPVTAVAIGKDEHEKIFIVSAARDRSLKKWNVQGQVLLSVAGHEKGDVNCLSTSETTHLIASGSQDKTICLWSPKSLETTMTLSGHRRGVWQVAFHKKNVASASSDKTVKVWSTHSGACLATLDGHESTVLCLLYLDDQIVSGSADGTIKLWSSSETNRCECTVRGGGGEDGVDDDDDEDKVWALAARRRDDDVVVYAASADGRIDSFRDATAEDAEETSRREAEIAEKEQTLRDALRRRDFKVAIDRAFDLDRPYTAWQAFSSIGEEDYREIFDSWTFDRAKRCLDFVKEWNTDGKKAPVAQRVLRALIPQFGASTLLGEDVGLRNALSAYTARHLARLDRLHQATYLLDTSLRELQEEEDEDVAMHPLVDEEEDESDEEESDDESSEDDDMVE